MTTPGEEVRAVERYAHLPRAGCVAGLHDVVIAANYNIVAERVTPTDAAMIVAALNDYESLRARAERAETGWLDAVKRAEQAEGERDAAESKLAEMTRERDEVVRLLGCHNAFVVQELQQVIECREAAERGRESAERERDELRGELQRRTEMASAVRAELERERDALVKALRECEWVEYASGATVSFTAPTSERIYFVPARLIP
jgi:hypothetical protein